ncbi:MAG: M56 family metallopeptidase [Ginsengibacter sp.]
MDTFISYIIKSFIASAILFLYYQLVLHNKKFHSYNRFYLLTSIVISLTLPLANFRWFQIKESSNITTNKILNVISSSDIKQESFHFQINWLLIGCSVFISISLLIVLLSKIIGIYKIKQKDKSIRMRGFWLIETDVKQAPFSFLNNLFWKRGMPVTDTYGEKIFKHELVHIMQRHTYDKLFAQITVCIFWFNPFFWLFQKELTIVHEFIADSASVENGDTESFAMMLLQSYNGGRSITPYHAFFNSPIKRRLIMITTSKNPRYSYLRRVLALPIMLLVVILFSFSIVKAQTDPKLNPGPVKVQKVEINKKNDSLAGVKINYIKDDGTPAVLNVTAKYSNSETNHDPLQSDNKSQAFVYDNESGERRNVSPEEVSNMVAQIIQNPPAEMIYFVDGSERSRESIKKLDPKKIKTINIFNHGEATKRYGEKAKNGVVVFTTK